MKLIKILFGLVLLAFCGIGAYAVDTNLTSNYNENNGDNFGSAPYWLGQTFNLSTDSYVSNLEFKLYRNAGVTGQVCALIMETYLNGTPTGVNFSSGTCKDVSTITTSTDGEIINFSFSSNPKINATKKYLAGLKLVSASGTLWYRDTTFTSYSGGSLMSSTTGTTWTNTSGRDMYFVVWGFTAGVTYNSILINNQTLNNNYINTSDVYFNILYTNISSVDNFSVNFNGTGYNKYLNLPFNNSHYFGDLFNTQIFGFGFNSTHYAIVKQDDSTLRVYNSSFQYESLINLSTLSGTFTDIEYYNGYWYTIASNIVYKLYNNLTYTGISYNLTSITGITNLTNGYIYFDKNINKWIVIERLNDARAYIFNNDWTYNNTYYSLGAGTTNPTDITFYEGFYYVSNGNANIYKYYSNFTYTSSTSALTDCGFALRGLNNYYNRLITSCGVGLLNKATIFIYNSTSTLKPQNDIYFVKYNLSDGNYTIKFNISVSETSTYNFTIDTTAPIITNTLPSEINAYSLNLNSYITTTETNLNYSNITFTFGGVTSTNATNSTNHTLTYNGNNTYIITAYDLAGNMATTSGILLVNPKAYFGFNESGTLLQNYTFGGYFWNTTYSNFTIYGNEINGLGSKNLTFNKTGYLTQTFSFTISNTSNINTTFNVSNASINVFIRDKNTFALITQNVSITLIGTTGLSGSTIMGLFNISNSLLIEENYSIIATATNYTTEVVYFTFDNQEVLNITIYLTNNSLANEGSLYLICNDYFGRGLAGAKLTASQWDTTTSNFIPVSQKIADDTGKGLVNIILNDKIYRFTCEYGGETAFIGDFNIPTAEDGTIKYITITGTSEERNYLFKDLQTSMNESISSLNITTITLFWNEINGLDVTGCIKVYYIDNLTNTKIFTGVSNCSTSFMGYMIISYDVNNLSNNYIISGEITYFDETYTIGEFYYFARNSISEVLKNLYFEKFLCLALVLFGVGIMFIGTREEYKLNNRWEYLGMLILILAFWLFPFLIPTYFTFKESTLVTFIIVGCILVISGGDK